MAGSLRMGLSVKGGRTSQMWAHFCPRGVPCTEGPGAITRGRREAIRGEAPVHVAGPPSCTGAGLPPRPSPSPPAFAPARTSRGGPGPAQYPSAPVPIPELCPSPHRCRLRLSLQSHLTAAPRGPPDPRPPQPASPHLPPRCFALAAPFLPAALHRLSGRLGTACRPQSGSPGP